MRRNRAAYNKRGGCGAAWRRVSYAQDHDFSGFDKSSNNLSFFQTQFTHCIRRYYRGDLLAPDRQSYLCHNSFDLNLNNPTDELVARTNSPKLSAALRDRGPFISEAKVSMQFALRYPVMPTLRFDSPELPRVDPSLESRIADAEHLGSVTKSHQLGMVAQESAPSSTSPPCRGYHKRPASSAITHSAE
jgi:hypothetical protein